MAVLGDKIFDEALDLPVEVRLRLVEKLLESLNLPTQAEIDRLWAEEAERRVAQIDRGDVVPIPADAVFAGIRAKYRR